MLAPKFDIFVRLRVRPSKFILPFTPLTPSLFLIFIASWMIVRKKEKKRNGWGWSFHPFNRFCKIFKFLIWGSRSSKFSIRPLGSLEIKEDSDDSDREESKGISELKKTMENHMTMATLIATVTFATGFTLPGGYIQDKDNNQGRAWQSYRSLHFQ